MLPFSNGVFFFSNLKGNNETLQKSKSMSIDNIVLKTTQSEKIAQISQKIQQQVCFSNSFEFIISSFLIILVEFTKGKTSRGDRNCIYDQS